MLNRIFEKKVSFLTEVLIILIIRLLIDLLYENIISLQFAYAGFLNKKTFSSGVISWVLLFVAIIALHLIDARKNERASSVTFQILFFLAFLPFTSCIKHGLFSIEYSMFAVVFWIFMFAFEMLNISTSIKPFPTFKFDGQKVNKYILFVVAFVSCIVTVLLCYKYTGLRIHLNLLTVYDIREEAEAYSLSSLSSYLFACTRAINPFMIAYCYLKNQKKYSIVFCICCLLNFGFDGSKTALFLPIVFFGIVYFRSHYNFNVKKMIMLGVLCIVVCCVIEYMINNTYYLCSYFIRRTMMVENLNSSYYYDFFTSHQPDYFRLSFLRHFGFKTPYPGLAKTIGIIYLNRGTNANCGLIADAITNFGRIGIIAYPLMVSILMRIVDKVSYNVDYPLKVCISLYIGLHIINSFLMTSLLTHGIFVLLVLTYCSSSVAETKSNMLYIKEFQYT